MQNIQTWVNRLKKLCPIGYISYENANSTRNSCEILKSMV
ncbi:hypothetical protein [Anoxybacillus flavithermus]|nr:hypothetical protein [Anoxybacillus flavithermus]